MKIAISQILALQRNDFRILMMRNPLAVSETERPLKAYLDYNMFRYLESGTVTLEQIKERLGWTGEIIFPFTSAHIQEVDAIPDDNPKRNEIINKRLEFFDSITNGYYLDNELDEPDRFTHWTRSGFTQYDTITEVPFAKEQMKMLANFVTKDQRKTVLDYMVEQTGVDPVQVINYTVPQVREHLEKLAKAAQMTFVEFIAKVES